MLRRRAARRGRDRPMTTARSRRQRVDQRRSPSHRWAGSPALPTRRDPTPARSLPARICRFRRGSTGARTGPSRVRLRGRAARRPTAQISKPLLRSHSQRSRSGSPTSVGAARRPVRGDRPNRYARGGQRPVRRRRPAAATGSPRTESRIAIPASTETKTQRLRARI